MIKTILFDNNGVITYSDNEVTIPRVAKYLNLDAEVLRPVFHKLAEPFDEGKISTKEFYTSIVKYFGTECDMDGLIDVVMNSYGLRPGMVELLKDLKEKKEIAMLTNFGDSFDELNENNWHYERLFDENKIFVSAKIKMRKPHEDIYLYALNELGRKPEEVVFVDDRESNLAPAQKIGMKTILFTSPAQLKDELKLILEKEKTKIGAK